MEMIFPQSGENTIIPVTMGEGKSSVIIPIVAATLADGHQLVRVIVPKPLMNQMFYLLADRLGGLANRPIFRFPFSRSSHPDGWKFESPCWEMSRCMEVCGILLIQPEHVLSLKLTSVESQLPERKFAARAPSKLQKLVHACAVSTLSLKCVSMTVPIDYVKFS